MNEITTHTFETFGKIVAQHQKQLDILNYYPYGNTVKFDHWLGGCADLSNLPNNEFLGRRYKKLTSEQLVYGIIEEVARAMNYLVVHGTHPGFDHQRIEAFALWRLFHNGIAGWRKDVMKDKSLKQIAALEKKNKDLYDLVLAHGKYADAAGRKNEKSTADYVKGLTPAERKKWVRNLKKSSDRNRKEYGVYIVDILPLTQYSNATEKPKILYTKQQLCAIHHYVICAFENLC
jgi:hypothetical protein